MHIKNILLLVLGVIVVGGGIFFVMLRGTQAPKTNSGQVTTQHGSNVVIENYKFSPSVLTVRKGTTVIWTNNDPVQHAVVGDQNSWVAGPAFKQGETYTHTFAIAGTYTYHCGIHPSMKGSVVVTE